MASNNKEYKVTVKPLNVTTSSTTFSYESGRSKYSYGTVNLDEYATQEDVAELKLELELEIADINKVTVTLGEDNTHVLVTLNEDEYTISEVDIASASDLEAEIARAKQAEQDIEDSFEEISEDTIDSLWG